MTENSTPCWNFDAEQRYRRHHPSRDRKRLGTNVRAVIMSALSLSLALGFNNFLTSFQDSLPNSESQLSKGVFFLCLFVSVMALAIILDADLGK